MIKSKFSTLIRSLLVIGLIFLSLTILWIVYPGETIVLYGDRSFEGASVYENGKLIATMEWDEANTRTYAKDSRLIGQYSIQKRSKQSNTPRDSLKMKIRAGDFDFKVITQDGKVYEKQYFGLEDIAYINLDLKTFDLVEE